MNRPIVIVIGTGVYSMLNTNKPFRLGKRLLDALLQEDAAVDIPNPPSLILPHVPWCGIRHADAYTNAIAIGMDERHVWRLERNLDCNCALMRFDDAIERFDLCGCDILPLGQPVEEKDEPHSSHLETMLHPISESLVCLVIVCASSSCLDYRNPPTEIVLGNRLLHVFALEPDPLGNVTTYTYDDIGRAASITDDLSGITEFAYDARRNLTSVTDALGNVTSYTYDDLHRLLTETNELSDTRTYACDDGGHLSTVTDDLSNATTHEYDMMGRVIEIIHAAPNGAGGSTTVYNVFSAVDKSIEPCNAASSETRYQEVAKFVRALFARYSHQVMASNAKYGRGQLTTVEKEDVFQTALSSTMVYFVEKKPTAPLSLKYVRVVWDKIAQRRATDVFQEWALHPVKSLLSSNYSIDVPPLDDEPKCARRMQLARAIVTNAMRNGECLTAVDHSIHHLNERGGRVLTPTEKDCFAISYEFSQTPAVDEGELPDFGSRQVFISYNHADELEGNITKLSPERFRPTLMNRLVYKLVLRHVVDSLHDKSVAGAANPHLRQLRHYLQDGWRLLRSQNAEIEANGHAEDTPFELSLLLRLHDDNCQPHADEDVVDHSCSHSTALDATSHTTCRTPDAFVTLCNVLTERQPPVQPTTPRCNDAEVSADFPLVRTQTLANSLRGIANVIAAKFNRLRHWFGKVIPQSSRPMTQIAQSWIDCVRARLGLDQDQIDKIFVTYDYEDWHDINLGLESLGGQSSAETLAWQFLCRAGLRSKVLVDRDLDPHNRLGLDEQGHTCARQLAQYFGMKVLYDHRKSIPACLIRVNNSRIIFIYRQLSESNKAWAICHEVAHELLGHRSMSYLIQDASHEMRENEANALASLWCHAFGVNSGGLSSSTRHSSDATNKPGGFVRTTDYDMVSVVDKPIEPCNAASSETRYQEVAKFVRALFARYSHQVMASNAKYGRGQLTEDEKKDVFQSALNGTLVYFIEKKPKDPLNLKHVRAVWHAIARRRIADVFRELARHPVEPLRQRLQDELRTSDDSDARRCLAEMRNTIKDYLATIPDSERKTVRDCLGSWVYEEVDEREKILDVLPLPATAMLAES